MTDADLWKTALCESPLPAGGRCMSFCVISVPRKKCWGDAVYLGTRRAAFNWKYE